MRRLAFCRPVKGAAFFDGSSACETHRLLHALCLHASMVRPRCDGHRCAPHVLRAGRRTKGCRVGKASGSRECAPDDRLRVPTIILKQEGVHGASSPLPTLRFRRDATTRRANQTTDLLCFSCVSIPFRKNISLHALPQIKSESAYPVPQRGVSRSSRTLERDAVDAAVPLTNGPDADGEVVWS